MNINLIKQSFLEGNIDLLEAKEFSRQLGYNMVKFGRSKATGLGGKWVWLKIK